MFFSYMLLLIFPFVNYASRIHFVAHLAHDGAAHGRDVHAVLHDDVELDGDGVVVIVGDADALAHGLAAEQMHQTIGHGAVGHALDAVAVGGGQTGDAGEDSAADGNIALSRLEFDHKLSFLMRKSADGCRLRTHTSENEHTYTF